MHIYINSATVIYLVSAKSEAVSRNSKPQRGRGGDRGHGRGRGRGRPEIVQLQGGVFCDGPAERMLRKSTTCINFVLFLKCKEFNIKHFEM